MLAHKWSAGGQRGSLTATLHQAMQFEIYKIFLWIMASASSSLRRALPRVATWMCFSNVLLVSALRLDRNVLPQFSRQLPFSTHVAHSVVTDLAASEPKQHSKARFAE